MSALGAAAIEVRGIERRFGGVRALDGVDLVVRPGELRCIIGPNGAGKSTLFKVLVGSERPDRGTVRLDGTDITGLPPHQRARRGIGIKFQSIDVLPGLTVRQNIALPLQRWAPGDAIETGCHELLSRLGLAAQPDLPAGALAHGQKQWLAIGMALATRPRALLLDEPTAGMGPEETRATAELVQSVNASGMTVVVIEHDMAFVRQLNAPVSVMHFGRIFAEGPFEEIEAHEDVRRIYLGRGTPRGHA